jgi:hypothetical protein
MAPVLLICLLSGCGGGGGPKTDADAVAKVLKDAAKAAADGNGDKACSYLTPDAQRQAVLQVAGGALGQIDCSQAVNRAQLILSPLEKKQIGSLDPSNVQINRANASATMATNTGAPAGQGMSVQLNLQKVGTDWKISGFVNEQGLPSG